MENFYRDIYHYLIHTKNIPRSEIDTEIIMEIKKEFPSESLQNIATLYSQIYFTNLENQKRFQTFAQKDVNFPLLKKIIQQYPEKTDSELIQIYSELYSKYKQYYDLYHWKNYYLDSQIKLDSSIVEWQPLVDFFESVILSDPDLAGFCQQMKEGDFTHKIDPKTGQFLSVISTPEKKKLIKITNKIYQKISQLKVPSHPQLFIYRCVQLNEAGTIITQLLPTSWTFHRGFAEYWCRSQKLYTRPFIIQISLGDFPFMVNVLNKKQYEVIVFPGTIKIIEKIDYKVVTYLIGKFLEKIN